MPMTQRFHSEDQCLKLLKHHATWLLTLFINKFYLKNIYRSFINNNSLPHSGCFSTTKLEGSPLIFLPSLKFTITIKVPHVDSFSIRLIYNSLLVSNTLAYPP